MACKTASVERVADKTNKAKEQIDKLQKMIEGQATEHKTKFQEQINAHLANAKITDARFIQYESNIKTEYTSEFSLDKIAGVVTKALKAAQVATDPKNPQASTSPEAISAYTDVVNAVAEAAKSSSTAAASLAFSMNRLAPGTIAFLYASSSNIQDDETFGKEAITTTAIYHQIIQSEIDVKLEGAFTATRLRVAADLETYKRFIQLQAALVDDLANEKISFDTYLAKDALYSKKAAELQKRVKDGPDNNIVMTDFKLATAQIDNIANSNQKLLLSAVKKLSTMGNQYNGVIEKVNDRITEGYFTPSL